MYDLQRGVSTQVTTEAQGAIWGVSLPDGRFGYSALEFAADGPSEKSYLVPATGRGEPEPWMEGIVFDVTESQALVGSTASGRMRIFLEDLASRERQELRVTRRTLSGRISPDGKWALLLIGGEALLTRLPSGDGEWLVSIGDVEIAAFSPDGPGIYFVNDEGLYHVSLQTEPEVVLGAPELIGEPEEGTTFTPKKEKGSNRFLVQRASASTGGDLVVVLGWASTLDGR